LGSIRTAGMDIQQVIYSLKAIGVDGIIRAIQYGLLRDQADRHYIKKNSASHSVSPGNLKKRTQISAGIQLEYEHARAELLYLKPNLVRVSWEPGKPPVPYTLSKSEWQEAHKEINIRYSNQSLSSDCLILSFNNHGGLVFKNHAGVSLRSDEPPVRSGERWLLTTALLTREHTYGLGERAGNLNLRPGNYTNWNTDAGGGYAFGVDPLYNCTPIYLSVSPAGCYLVYFENSYPSTFRIGSQFEAEFISGMLRYYVITGSLAEIYTGLANLTGYSCMPPRWALGYHQSRWSYRTENEVRALVAGFEEHNLPLSAIHLDIDYMDGYRVFTINTHNFPDIRQLVHDLAEKGIHTVTSINPAVKCDENYQVYTGGITKEVYCQLPDNNLLTGTSWPGWSVFPDFTAPSARSWWQEQYQPFVDLGISGIWHDMNEPASFAAWGDKSFPKSTCHYMEEAGGDHLEAHNLYGLLMNQAGYEALRKYNPGKRPWILSRAGWAGVQKYAWNWTGDVNTSWENLRLTIPTVLGLSLSGQPFTGVDIGGFSGNPTAELYLRWFQLAAFLPFFRTHSAIGTKPREPWVFGGEITDIIRDFMSFRYQMMPYLYTLSWQASQTGLPLLRPIFWDDPQDDSLWDVPNEFLLGDSLLVAPVLYPGACSRQIVLPSGRWYSFWDDQVYDGPMSMNFPVDNKIIPLFIKGGSILPMEANGQLTVNIYVDLSRKTVGRIYSDSGDGYESWRLDTFHLEAEQNKLNILWEKTGEYPFPYSQVKLTVHGTHAVQLTADGILHPMTDNSANLPLFDSAQIIID
jgi:alpha-glucosidase